MSAFNNFMGGKIMDSNYSVAVNVAVDGKDIGKPFNLVSFSNSDYESEDIKEMKEVSILSIAIRYNNVPLFIKCMKDPHSELEMTEEDSKRYVGRPYGIEFYPDGTAKALASVGKRYYKGEEI
ncbi:hypothetical protein M2S00_06810 [Apilactobacillus sp. TMW 2.2459]|uniref:hypothetical protein n=1 Tax=Apilactobacillus xinyiensis TaxID=2841032 RepID=UPI0020108952|nr:hypothetical protein [Apilactobacillus xinyiensis]MCL0312815.1 hypothetical protein [Apilactobacillus xinyiensis]